MSTLYQIFAVCALFVLAKAGDNDCSQLNAHYLEMGCKPIYTNKDGGCPERFECPFMARSNDDTKCYLKNKMYSAGDRPKENEIEHSCSASCFCSDISGKASFTCANIECPEFFIPPSPEKAQCVKQYKLRDCCSSKEVCDKAEIEKLATCTYGTETYKEGQKFYPENTCKTCVCTSEYDGTLKSPYCEDINCGIELHHDEDIKQKCAPVYFENRNCCPIEWKCYENEQIDRSLGRTSSDENMQCHFGDMHLNVGDKVMATDKCLTCKCEVPPMVTCIRSMDC